MRWLRVLGALALVAVDGFIAATSATFAFVRMVRGVESVQWTDIALPWRWDRYRVARGEKQVVEARRLAENGKLAEALLYVRAGVARAPAHRDGRLLLFDLLVAARRPQVAQGVLLEGLRFHAQDPIYLKPVLAFLLQQQEDAQVIALAGRMLSEVGSAGEAAGILAHAAATAGYLRGNYDQAEDFLGRVPGLIESRDGRLLGSKIERERGYAELAEWRLRQLAADAPGDGEVMQELVVLLRAQGRADEARRINLSFQIAHPELAGPRIELLRAYREAGETARVARDADALLAAFAGDRSALLALADFGAQAGEVALVQRVAAHAKARQWPPAAFEFLVVEAALVARDYRGALDAIRGHRTGGGEWALRHRALFDSLQALAHFGLGDYAGARSALDSFLAQPNLRSDNLLAVANRFAAWGGAEQAWLTLARAVEIDPLNQAALTRLIELDLELGRMPELAMHMRQFVKMRRPSPDILRVVHYKLGSDLWLFSAEAPRTLEVVRTALAAIESGPLRR